MKDTPVYQVKKLNGQSINIDGNWNKPAWKNHQAVTIEHIMGDAPAVLPRTKAKLTYDEHYIYGAFQVEDTGVRSIIQEINGNVSADSCVEFFFSPDVDVPHHYFNLEINAGGTPLMHHVTVPRKNFTKFKVEDFDQIEIAHSLPDFIDPEIDGPVTWTIEFKVPFSLLEKYAKITHPQSGVVWRCNFYKTAGHTSNPHYLTWAPVDNPFPDFHKPDYFGAIAFD